MYEIIIHPNSLTPWSTQVYAGLYELQRSGKVKISLSTQLECSELLDTATLSLEARNLDTGDIRTILIDLGDFTCFSVQHSIEMHDYVVKRSYLAREIDKLPTHLKTRVFPYGVNYNCCSRIVPIFQLFCAHHLMRSKLLRKPKSKNGIFSWHDQVRFMLYMYKNNVSLYEEDYEGTPGSPSKFSIFFVTRLFEFGGDLTEFSRERIALVKALRKEFGTRFCGGIVKTPISERHCPKGLLQPKVSRREFTKTLRESDIAICTLGLGNSNPWKLGEAIAGARCIVSEPLFFELPVPLEEGIHLRTFISIDDCLQVCEELIRKPDTIRQMKEQVWRYYQQHVKAEQLTWKIITDAFNYQN